MFYCAGESLSLSRCDYDHRSKVILLCATAEYIYTCTCILQASFPQDEHFSRGIPCPALQVCLNTCPNLHMSVCAWHWRSTFVQLHDKSQEWRNGGHRLWSCFWVSYTGQHWFSLLVSFSYSILWARYTVHYLGGMNKSNEDTWVYILNMDEPGIKPNILNPTLYLQFLPIPELIPFRLTRQLRNLMMPLQVHGLMESTMIHTLRALRNNCDLLLNTMDIFVKEPSVDWLVSTHIYR